MAVEQLTDGSPDGATVGRSDEKISLYDVPPVARQTVAEDTTTFSMVYDHQEIEDLQTTVNNLIDALHNLGAIEKL